MIQHVTREIPPATLDECVRFYGILGLEPLDVPAGIVGRAVWLAASGRLSADLHLMLNEHAGPALGHVAFVLERYQETVAALSEAGFEVEPRREHWGAARAYVRDPASNLVELMAAAPR
jgi:catechol 2,3-dioxygenase-like lactoylglutathione lyase family enzyme